MKYLIIGGTGTVGSEVVRHFAGSDDDVLVLSRSREKLAELPAGVRGVQGDLLDRQSLDRAMEGVDRLFLLTPLSETETKEGLNAVEAAGAAAVKRIVNMSVHRVETIPEAPHFASKIQIAKALESTGIPFTLIMPNSFFQNDHWFKDVMLQHGVYPQPIGSAGVNRVDTRDIAEACFRALTGEGHEGRSYPLVGRDLLSGPQVAEIWSRHLGKTIRYGGDDLNAWAKAVAQMLPPWLVNDLRIMYDGFQKMGLKASEEEFRQQEEILEHPPRRFEDFAAETAKAWLA